MDELLKKQLEIAATKVRMGVIEGVFNAKAGNGRALLAGQIEIDRGRERTVREEAAGDEQRVAGSGGGSEGEKLLIRRRRAERRRQSAAKRRKQHPYGKGKRPNAFHDIHSFVAHGRLGYPIIPYSVPCGKAGKKRVKSNDIFCKLCLTDPDGFGIIISVDERRNQILGNCVTAAPTTLTRIV